MDTIIHFFLKVFLFFFYFIFKIYLKLENSILGFGRNDKNQLGIIEKKNHLTPTYVLKESKHSILSAHCSINHSFVLLSKKKKKKLFLFLIKKENGDLLFSGENKFFESENPVFNCFNKVKDMVFMISTCENITALTTSNIFFNKKYFSKTFLFF